MDKKNALQKAESYCAYQERSQQEVRDKLYSFELRSAEVEELIAVLIENNFINEERFAQMYILGKFRMKHWGRMKIRQGLKLKGVPAKMIEKVLSTVISEDDYLDTLRGLLERKNLQITEKNGLKRKQLLVRYAQGKGFETELIFDILNSSELE